MLEELQKKCKVEKEERRRKLDAEKLEFSERKRRFADVRSGMGVDEMGEGKGD